MTSHSHRRSRSPHTDDHSSYRQHHRRRSPSPHPHHTSSDLPHHRRSSQDAPVILPANATRLGKHDFETYKPMFALYLDIQKQLVLEEMEEKEIKGRWKSFVGKWNRGELAEGWYHPDTLKKAQLAAMEEDNENPVWNEGRRMGLPTAAESGLNGEEDEDDEGSFGPALPTKNGRTPVKEIAKRGKNPGPSIPNFQDLEERDELAAQSAHDALLLHRHARKEDRTYQKEFLDALLPRADPGTRARHLEKKADLRSSNNSFTAAKTDSSLIDVPDSELLGGGEEESGLDGFKKRKREEERKKNEREERREEILRARREEREERVREYRVKEERTMEGLVALARARFG